MTDLFEKHPGSKGGREDWRTYAETDDLVLQIIRLLIAEHGWPPTVREIGALIERGATEVHLSLIRLAKDGRIVRGPGPRMIRVVES